MTPRFRDDSKERVRDAVDMVDLVSAHTELRRAGASRLQGLCPFHEERTPSFGIDPGKKVYHCFGCGASGDVFTFVMEKEGLDFVGALESLADRYGVELEVEQEDPQAAARRRHRDRLHELLARTAAFYARSLWESGEASGAREYLAGRGLDEAILREFQVGYAPSAWDRVTLGSRRAGFSEEELIAAGVALRSKRQPGSVFDRFRRRIMFPLTDARGRVLGFGGRAVGDDQQPKYLNSSENEVFHKGRQLFGAHLARAHAAGAGSVIVAEGYTDVLALHQAGLRNSVGLMGTALTPEQIAELGRLAGVEGHVELALDADASGQEAMVRAARVAAGRRLKLRVVPMDAGTDPADLVAQEGGDAMRARVERSVPFARFHVERVLAGADLGSPDGRDRALAQLRDVLGAIPLSSERDDLVRLVAGRLGLSEQLVGSLALTPGGRPDAALQVGRDAGTGSRPRAETVLDRRERNERTFLASCMALPEPGARALQRVDLEQHFTSPLVRRAAAHLREHLHAPLDGVGDDAELTALLAELTLGATRESDDPAALEVKTLQLEKDRLEREIAAAQGAQGGTNIASLAAERTRVMHEMDQAIDREMEASAPRSE